MDKIKILSNPIIIAIIFYIVLFILNIILFYIFDDNICFEKYWYFRDAISAIIIGLSTLILKMIIKRNFEGSKSILLKKIFKYKENYDFFITSCFCGFTYFIIRFIPHLSHVILFKNTGNFGSHWVFEDLLGPVIITLIISVVLKPKKTKYQSGGAKNY